MYNIQTYSNFVQSCPRSAYVAFGPVVWFEVHGIHMAMRTVLLELAFAKICYFSVIT